MKILIYILLLIPWLLHFISFPSDVIFIPTFFNSIQSFFIISTIIYSLLVYAFYMIIKENKVDQHFLFAYIGLYLLLQSTYVSYPLLYDKLFFIILLFGVVVFNILFYLQVKKHLAREQFLILPSILLSVLVFLFQFLLYFQIINK